MVKVSLMTNEDFEQCSSCLKSTEETALYQVEIGKTMASTISLKLCHQCLLELEKEIGFQTKARRRYDKLLKSAQTQLCPLQGCIIEVDGRRGAVIDGFSKEDTKRLGMFGQYVKAYMFDTESGDEFCYGWDYVENPTDEELRKAAEWNLFNFDQQLVEEEDLFL